ncbi:MAG: hypothetical protein A3G49_00810 [Candidatus Sungbacteria bacterium RIFCSPLOWO2_12_FULL_41_11]|uniref:DUF86 domain-containing protein n=1 Tax=Candidatus Sungbacteria bacterium RIFCSPLOWO2_12_FULL_41_11 TaxID=1802286 RepID=A0A1G2LM92_9BACT|nr:MAG: hypothetical protein A3G49_00810 [Candidatus Sungbacteria bacterium RIFCSPLOWO2_12_FULL_41_11]
MPSINLGNNIFYSLSGAAAESKGYSNVGLRLGSGNNIIVLNKEFIQRKLFLNQKDLEYLKEFEGLSIDEIARDPGKHAAVERYLERLISRAIDINQHIIAEKIDITVGTLTYRDTFLKLADAGAYPKEFAEKIAPSAGLRNALVHEYNNIDPEMLRKSIGEAIQEYNDYARYIIAFLEKE